MLIVQAIAPVNPGVDNRVRCPRTCRGAVGNINARPRAEVVTRTGDAVFGAAAQDRIEVVARVESVEEPPCLGPALPAVERLDQDVISGAGEADGKLIGKQVHDAVAIGSDRAARRAEAMNLIERVVFGWSHRLLLPRVAAVARRGHHQGRRECVAFAVAAEGGIAQVDVAEERAR